jgi:Glycosyl hydrolases family 2, TIM barrel domain
MQFNVGTSNRFIGFGLGSARRLVHLGFGALLSSWGCSQDTQTGTAADGTVDGAGGLGHGPPASQSATPADDASEGADPTSPVPCATASRGADKPSATGTSEVNDGEPAGTAPEPTAPETPAPETTVEPSATSVAPSNGDAGAGAQAGEPEAPAGGGGAVGTGGSSSPPTGQGVRTEGRRLLVDGEPFQIRGVNWNPVPKGAGHPDGLDYAGFADQDIALMAAAGINVVRTYERLEDRAVLDKLHAAGIRVFSTVYGWWQDDPSVVTERVNAVKDHPAILAWVLGNEWNYNKLYGNENLTLEQARDQINAAASLVKQADPAHPVSSIYGELDGLEAMVESMPDIDIWGINAYRGIGFGDLFSRYEGLANKPMYLGEYGADAYNAEQGAYDPSSQAEAVRTLTQALLDNGVDESGVTLGGFVFEWADEWWKVNGGELSVQDTGGVAPGGGPHPDGVFNEEWWGIVDIDRNPRPAYDALVELYAD